MKSYKVVLAPGEQIPINAVGDFVRVHTANQVLKLETDTGTSVNIESGQDIRIPKFDRLLITNTGSLADTATLLIGIGGFNDARISGVVEVINGGLIRSKNGIAYLSTGHSGPLASEYSHVQLWNPAGSGVRLVVDSVTLNPGAACSMHLRSSSAALANMYTVTNPNSKAVGGVVSVSENRVQTNPALQGDLLVGIRFNSSESYTIDFNDPMVLNGGTGLIAVSVLVNTETVMSAQFYEEEI